MRALAFIFSLYIFGLALLPCGDGADRAHDNPVSVQVSHTHDADHHHTDMCTPFCLCQCCQMSMVALTISSVTAHSTPHHVATAFYNRNFQSGFPTHIFQPPIS